MNERKLFNIPIRLPSLFRFSLHLPLINIQTEAMVRAYMYQEYHYILIYVEIWKWHFEFTIGRVEREIRYINSLRDAIERLTSEVSVLTKKRNELKGEAKI